VYVAEQYRWAAVAGAWHDQLPNVLRSASVSRSDLTSTRRPSPQMRSVTKVASPLSTNPEMTVDLKATREQGLPAS